MKTLRAAYQFCARCGTGLALREGYAVCSANDCGHREFYNPRPNVSAALVVGEDQIVLTRRASDPYRGTWELPGGFQQAGESLEDALRREISEELPGIALDDIHYVSSGYVEYPFGDLLIPVSAVVFRAAVTSLDGVTLGVRPRNPVQS